MNIPDRTRYVTEAGSNEQQGLSLQDVARRKAAGAGNNVRLQTGRSYRQIFQENLFTFINAAFLTITVVMLMLNRVSDGFLVVVVIFGGVIINIYQEIWAKRQLDRIALLSRPRATVIREGRELSIDPSEIVLGDRLVVRSGDQIVVDGEISGDGQIEVDESLLTGESDVITKRAGEAVYSGSFCVSGSACYVATQVGKQTLAYQLTVKARAFRQMLTPLQREINLVIRIFLLIACFLWILVGISFFSRTFSLNDLAQRAAVIAGLVPAGLLLAITLAYGLGAVRMVGQDVLIQQANAVESLSNVNVLCLDKTGTLTTNQLELSALYPIGVDEVELRSLLGHYAASTTAGNRTVEAIAAACPGVTHPTAFEIPFSSSRKWSALTLAENPDELFVLGAPEVLLQQITLSGELHDLIEHHSEQGLRLLLFARGDRDPQWTEATLPDTLKPLGILQFSDRLRPEAQTTLDEFVQAGLTIKVISGDSPKTVAALAHQAGLCSDFRVISGAELAALDEAQFAQAARSYTVFGRVTPEQKAQLVTHLRRSGAYVAMIGDGVNDILSLKQANLAIAMESGSKATRGVADIVLLKDSFGSLPKAFLEGQRIRNGIQDVLKLFLVRTFCVTLLIFATAIVTDGFPFENKQSAIISLMGVGLPSLCIPIWAKPGLLPQRSMVRSILHFVVPATLALTTVSLMVYLFYLVVAVLDLPPGLELSQVNYAVPRSALVSIFVMCELLLLLFLKPPTPFWVGGEPLSGDWRYTWVALGLLGIYVLIVAIPPVRQFFELAPLGLLDHGFISLVALEWCLVLRLLWRSRFLDRVLGVNLS